MRALFYGLFSDTALSLLVDTTVRSVDQLNPWF